MICTKIRKELNLYSDFLKKKNHKQQDAKKMQTFFKYNFGKIKLDFDTANSGKFTHPCIV